MGSMGGTHPDAHTRSSLAKDHLPTDLHLHTYVFKLAKSIGVTQSGESEQVLLLFEIGVRLHSTEFAG